MCPEEESDLAKKERGEGECSEEVRDVGRTSVLLLSFCVTADSITAVRFVQMGLADSSHGIRIARGAKTLCPYWSDSLTYDVFGIWCKQCRLHL